MEPWGKTETQLTLRRGRNRAENKEEACRAGGGRDRKSKSETQCPRQRMNSDYELAAESDLRAAATKREAGLSV